MFRRPSVKKFGDKISNYHQHLYGRNVCQWCASYVSAVDRYSKCTSNILSKLFEKHICDHLYDFLEENALLHHLQSGFRKLLSTEIAHIRLIDQLLLDLDKNRATGQVFIDYKKAFDSIDHDLLLTKLNVSGICGHELDFLRNNLSERKQYVVIDGCRPPPMNCNGWSTTREHTGLHYVSPVQQRPTLSNSAFYRLYLCRWHHFQFLIRRDRWTSWHHISPSTRPRWPFTVVGCQQDGHERRRDEMSLSDRETPYK